MIYQINEVFKPFKLTIIKEKLIMLSKLNHKRLLYINTKNVYSRGKFTSVKIFKCSAIDFRGEINWNYEERK